MGKSPRRPVTSRHRSKALAGAIRILRDLDGAQTAAQVPGGRYPSHSGAVDFSEELDLRCSGIPDKTMPATPPRPTPFGARP
jgi:hypothetical protein